MRLSNDDLLASVSPFGLIEKLCPAGVRLITDHAGSIPLYYSQQRDRVVAGESSLEVARQLENPSLDPVSVADFLLNRTVCYPYTLFEGVYVAPPGAVTDITPTGVRSETYFVPAEGDEASEDNALAYWATRLREEVERALLHGISGRGRAKILFSGGEDSRALVSLLPREIECELVTFADGYNREVRLAEKAARALGRPLTFRQRPQGFYRLNLKERARLIGGGFDVRATHVYGELAESVKDAGALVGGYTADALFKSVLMGNVRKGLKQLGPETLEYPYPDYPMAVKWACDHPWVKPEVAAAVDERRWTSHRNLKEIRPRSAGNWHFLWPLGCHEPHYAHYLAARQVGPPVVEPFMAPQVYRTAAAMPDQFRVDRIAFRAAFGRGMGPAGWMQTSSGRVPNLGGYPGHWLQLATVAKRRLQDGLFTRFARWRGQRRTSQGAWGQDDGIFRFEWEHVLSDRQLSGIRDVLEGVLRRAEFDRFFQAKSEPVLDMARYRALQIAYLMDD